MQPLLKRKYTQHLSCGRQSKINPLLLRSHTNKGQESENVPSNFSSDQQHNPEQIPPFLQCLSLSQKGKTNKTSTTDLPFSDL